jgi:peptidoglycan-N-acetylglucosamine deacetylase
MARVRRIGVIMTAMALLAGATAAAGWRLHKSRTFQLVGELIPRVNTPDSVVALTFDDGPTVAFTEEILTLLAERRVSATFFLVGSAIEREPDLARRIAAAGHEIGNHSWSHQPMVLRRPSSVQREVEATDRIIRQIGYAGPIHFRAPYGKRLLALPWYLMRTGRPHVLWDIEPESYPQIARDSARIVEHVIERVRPGSIILLHPFFESRRATITALPAVIDALRDAGYRIETVSALLERRPAPLP